MPVTPQRVVFRFCSFSFLKRTSDIIVTAGWKAHTVSLEAFMLFSVTIWFSGAVMFLQLHLLDAAQHRQGKRGKGGYGQPSCAHHHSCTLVLTVCYLYNRGNKYVHRRCWDASNSFFEPHTRCTARGSSSSSSPVAAFFPRLYLAHLCHLLQY